MIDYIDVKNFGFKRVKCHDEVYENQHGREYWWMQYDVTIIGDGFRNKITFIWNCDVRDIKVFLNDTTQIDTFDDFDKFAKYFEMFRSLI